MHFPDLIKATRKALGETQKDFGDRFEATANTVSRWESGQYPAPYIVIEFLFEWSDKILWTPCPTCEGSGRVKVEEA